MSTPQWLLCTTAAASALSCHHAYGDKACRESDKTTHREPCTQCHTACVAQVNSGPLQAYYKAAYAAVRKHSSSCFVAIAPRVYEQDGFEWQHFMTGPGYTNVLQDLHRCAQPGPWAAPEHALADRVGRHHTCAACMRAAALTARQHDGAHELCSRQEEDCPPPYH